MAVTDTLIDTVFDGRYRVLRKLGAGGMANVYLAEDQELGRNVAIKILDDRHASDGQFVERFRREAKNAAGLSHPNIVSIYDRGEAEGTYYIAMEYCEGQTLKDLINARGPTPPRVAIDYTRQILAAVGFAHRNGIVHRDIKPHNVLVDSEGRLKVTDFGIARSGASQMTEVGSIIGTAQYLSPEQARGASVGPSSDLYSVGVVLYEMLTGEVPFTGDTPLEIAMKHLSAIPDPPSRKNPAVSRDLDLVTLRALAKNPKNRYQSAEEMDADLERVGRGSAVSNTTENAATVVLAGAAGLDAAKTTVTRPLSPVSPRPPVPRTPPAGYYGFDEPPRRRAIWPWIVVALLIAGAVVGGWFLYKKVQHQLEANKPVPVPQVVGIQQQLAVNKITQAGLTPRVGHHTDEAVPPGVVITQQPGAGDRIDKGNTVTIVVSKGKPKVLVPDVRGKTQADAISTLANAKLVPQAHQVFSTQTPGTVIAQDPKFGTHVVQGTAVRINVSAGVKPVTVPSIVGESYDQAASDLEAAGFKVFRQDVASDGQKGIVLSQDPGGNTDQPPGSTVTLKVSKGPSTTLVPDVTSQTQADAVTMLTNSNFKVNVTSAPVDFAEQDGLVVSQSPAGGRSAKPGSTVTIVIGRYTAPPPTTTVVTTAPATTTTGTTTGTTTTPGGP